MHGIKSKSVFQVLVASLFMFLICNSNMAVAQCALYPVPLEERILDATLIVEAKVIREFSFWDVNHKSIYTAHALEVYKVFKGPPLRQVLVVTEGGRMGRHMEVSYNGLKLRDGDFGIFFCETSKKRIQSDSILYSAVAGPQGFVKYDVKGLSALDVFVSYKSIQKDLYNLLERHLNHPFLQLKDWDSSGAPERLSSYKTSYFPTINSFSPASIPAGTQDRLTIFGSGFGATRGTGKVAFKNSNDGGRTKSYAGPSQYISWVDTKIVVELPDTAGTGTIEVVNSNDLADTSINALIVPYSRSNLEYKTVIERPQLVDKEGTGGYVWQMNVDFNSNSNMSQAFTNALTAWRCATKVNWSLGENTAINEKGSDNVNVVTLDTRDRLPKGVLGVCYSYYSACSNDGIWFVSEYDIIFRDTSFWHFGLDPITKKQYDMESVMMHELGHGQQLDHVIDKNDLMHYALGGGMVKRTISPGALTGATRILDNSTTSGACNYFPMHLLSADICSDAGNTYFYFKEMEITTQQGKPVGNFSLESESRVTVDVYTLLGQYMGQLIDEVKPAGIHSLPLDATQNILTEGMYLLRVSTGNKTYTKKLFNPLLKGIF